MYHIKVVKKGKATMHPICTHYTVETHAESMEMGASKEDPDDKGYTIPAGIIILMAPSGKKIVLPDDGDTVYVENERGTTVDTYHWPIREKKPRGPR